MQLEQNSAINITVFQRVQCALFFVKFWAWKVGAMQRKCHRPLEKNVRTKTASLAASQGDVPLIFPHSHQQT